MFMDIRSLICITQCLLVQSLPRIEIWMEDEGRGEGVVPSILLVLAVICEGNTGRGRHDESPDVGTVEAAVIELLLRLWSLPAGAVLLVVIEASVDVVDMVRTVN